MAFLPTISFGGINSGLDTKSVIAALLQVRGKPIQLLAEQQGDFQAVKARYQKFKGLVDQLRSAAAELKKPAGLLAHAASSSADAVLGVSAGGTAAAGSFQVTVNALASAEVEASNGFADFDTTAVGNGTLTITVGGEAHDVAISAGADTLEDVRDAINLADAGVTATIVSEGTGATPYKLVVTADQTGAANSIAFDLSGFTGALSFAQTQAAANASLTVNGLTVQRSTNVVDDVVPGLTFTLKSTGTSTVSVAPDVEKVREKVEKYVETFNTLVGFVNQELTLKEGGDPDETLFGERAVRDLKERLLRLTAQNVYPGGSFSGLHQVGLSVGKDGLLSLDAAEFDAAAADHLEDLTSLFTTVGDVVDGTGFSVVKVPDSLAGGSYAVSITQAATKAQVDAAGAFAAGGLAADETLTFTSGAASVDVQLLVGDTLEQAVDKINEALQDGGLKVVAGDEGGTLRFTAVKYGAAASFDVSSDVAAGPNSSGVGTSTLAASGLDVAGTIGGAAATGEGQVLKGGGAFAGVEIRYTGTGPATSNLSVGTDGFFVALNQALDHALLPISGPIEARLASLDASIDGLGQRIDDQEDRLEQYEAFLIQRFAALEQIIGKLQSQQSALAGIAGTFPGL